MAEADGEAPPPKATLVQSVVRGALASARDVSDWWNSPIAGVELLVDNDSSMIELVIDTARKPLCARPAEPGFLTALKRDAKSSAVVPLVDGMESPKGELELVPTGREAGRISRESSVMVQDHEAAYAAETAQARKTLKVASIRVARLADEADAVVVKSYALRDVLPVAWGKFEITGCGRKETHRFSRLNPCLCAAPSAAQPAFVRAMGYVRWLAVWIATWKAFDMFILALIVINSVLMALSDYSLVDATSYEPVSGMTGVDTINTADPWCAPANTTLGAYNPPCGDGFAVNNYINELGEYVFTVLFTIEMVTKMIAMGVILDAGSYLRNGWNWLDFIVVVSGLAAAIPGMPKITVLRLFRLMRPLRSLNAIPELKIQVSAMLAALPKLGDVVTLLAFFMIIFAILALQLFGGKLHYRCRLTEYPVAVPFGMMGEYNADMQNYAAGNGMSTFLNDVITNGTVYPPCADASGVRLPTFDSTWTQVNSPWHTSRDCVWPINHEDTRVCNNKEETATYAQPSYACPDGTFCGSNYDFTGNSRFSDLTHMQESTWSPDFAFGYTMFDSLPAALVVIIQCITLEGWTDVMYMAMDSTGTIIPVIFFVILVMLFSVFLMNFFLAVLFDEQEKMKDGMNRANKLEAEVAKAKEVLALNDAGVIDATPAFDIFEVAHRLHEQQLARTKWTWLTSMWSPLESITVRVNWTRFRGAHYRRADALSGSPIDAPPCGGASPCCGIGGVFACGRGEWYEGTFAPDEGPSITYAVAVRDYAPPAGSGELPLKKGAEIKNLEWTGSHWAGELDDAEDGEEASHGAVNPENMHAEGTFKVHMKSYMWTDSVFRNSGKTVAILLAPLDIVTRICYYITESTVFNSFIIALIIANTAVLAMDRYPADHGMVYILDIINFVLTVCFTVEMVLKSIGLGLRQYIRDSFNLFDCVVVIFSIIEIAAAPAPFLKGQPYPTADNAAGGAISALRTLRLLRILKLARNWKEMQMLLIVIVELFQKAFWFMIILFLFLFIYSLMGMQFFGNRFNFDSATHKPIPLNEITSASEFERPRAHFDNLLMAFTTVFQCLSGENWNAVMYDGWRSMGPLAVLYFISMIVLGAYIVMNIFVSGLLISFDEQTEENNKRLKQQREMNTARQIVKEKILAEERLALGDVEAPVAVDEEQPRACACFLSPEFFPAKAKYCCFGWGSSKGCFGRKEVIAFLNGNPSKWVEKSIGDDVKVRREVALPEIDETKTMSIVDALKESCKRDPTELVEGTLVDFKVEDDQKTYSVKYKDETRNDGKAEEVFYLHQTTPERILNALTWVSFDNFILTLIIISSLLLALESPLWDPESTHVKILFWVEIVINIIFSLEMFIKIFAYGFMINEGAYIRDGWNRMDFFIVVASWITMGLGIFGGGMSELKGVRTIRLLRVLRPLRAVNKNPGLKLVVNALLAMVPNVINIALLMVFFFLIWAIVGTSYFKGALSACEGYGDAASAQQELIFDPVEWSTLTAAQKAWGDGEYDGVTSKAVCEWMGLGWSSTVSQSFDNVLASFSSFWEMITTEGWVDVMFAYADSRGLEMQPKEFTDEMTTDIFFSRILIFIVYIMLGTFIMMNMFIGVVVSTFSTIKEMNSGEGGEGGVITTKEQAEWQRTKEAMMKLKARVKVQDVPRDCSTWIVHTSNRFRQLCGKSTHLQPGVWNKNSDGRFTNAYQRRLNQADLPPLSVAPLCGSSTSGVCIDRAVCIWRLPFFFLVQKLKCFGPASDGAGGRPQRNEWSFPYSLLKSQLDSFKGVSKWKDGEIIDITTGHDSHGELEAMFRVVQQDLSPENGTEYKAISIRSASASSAFCATAQQTDLKRGDKVEFKHVVKHWVQTLPVVDFDAIIMACIIGNTVVMAMGFWGQSADYAQFIIIANYVFAAIFTVEAVIKLVAFGLDKYFDDNWNKFDFAIVVGTLAGLMAKWITGSDAGSIATVIRTFRIGRVFRMVKRLGNLRVLFQSIILSLPALMNVAVILMMAMFIFAILGVQLFAKLEMPDDGTLGGYNHFMTFWSSLLLLLRAMTGEAWPDMMYDMGGAAGGGFLLAAPTVQPTMAPTSNTTVYDTLSDGSVCNRWSFADRSDPPFKGFENVCGFMTSSEPAVSGMEAFLASVNPYHDPYNVECCPIHGNGNLWVAWIFWLAFNLVIPTVMIELIVFYILESFLDQSNDEASVVDIDMQDAIATAWEEVDPDGDGYVSRKGLITFFRHLDEPMGFPKGMRDLKMLEIVHTQMMVIPKMHRGTKQYWFPDVSRGIATKIDSNWTKEWDDDVNKDNLGLVDDASAMTSVLQMLELYRTYRFRRALQMSVADQKDAGDGVSLKQEMSEARAQALAREVADDEEEVAPVAVAVATPVKAAAEPAPVMVEEAAAEPAASSAAELAAAAVAPAVLEEPAAAVETAAAVEEPVAAVEEPAAAGPE